VVPLALRKEGRNLTSIVKTLIFHVCNKYCSSPILWSDRKKTLFLQQVEGPISQDTGDKTSEHLMYRNLQVKAHILYMPNWRF